MGASSLFEEENWENVQKSWSNVYRRHGKLPATKLNKFPKNLQTILSLYDVVSSQNIKLNDIHADGFYWIDETVVHEKQKLIKHPFVGV